MTVTESLVDASDDAVKEESRSEFAQAVAALWKDMLRSTQRIIGWVTVVGGVWRRNRRVEMTRTRPSWYL